jgi:leader peptidase (prepilin peptidase)/N-methyltransferase
MFLVSSFILLYYFLLVVVIDIEHHLILHSTSIFGAVLGIWIGIHLHGVLSTLLGGLSGFGAMLGLYALGMLVMRLLHRVQGDNPEGQEAEGLGFGDVNLAGVIGLLLGWPGIVLGLIITILLAGVASLAYLGYKGIRREIKAEMAIPYGPFLVGSVVILLYLRELFW